MANARMIHKSILDSNQFNNLTIPERLLYICTIILADDEGRLRADTPFLKAKIYPYKMNLKKFQEMIDNIVKQDLLITYTANNALFACHPNWLRYQRIRSDRKKESVLPEPPAGSQTAYQPTTSPQPNVDERPAQSNSIQSNLNKNNLFRERAAKAVEKQNPQLAENMRNGGIPNPF